MGTTLPREDQIHLISPTPKTTFVFAFPPFFFFSDVNHNKWI